MLITPGRRLLFYEIGGVLCCFHCHDGAIANTLTAVFSYFGQNPVETSRPAKASFVLSTENDGSDFDCLVDSGNVVGFGDVRLWESPPGIIFIKGQRARARLDLQNSCGMVFVHTAFSEDTSTLQGYQISFFMACLFCLVCQYDVFPLHAASLNVDGKGCLFISEGGQGKSTMTLGLVKQGWKYQSDDSLLLRTNGPAVETLSWRTKLFLRPDSMDIFPEFKPFLLISRIIGDRKQYLDMESLFPSQILRTSQPRVLFFPRITDDPTSVVSPMPKSEAFYHLIRQSNPVFVNRMMITRQLVLLSILIKQTSHYYVRLGKDSKACPGRISPLLREIINKG